MNNDLIKGGTEYPYINAPLRRKLYERAEREGKSTTEVIVDAVRKCLEVEK